MDFTTVKTARKVRQERPVLPQQVNQTVSKELKDHLREQKTKDIKTRPQEQMEPETKEEKIKDMLNRQSLVIGAAPISNAHLEEVERKMIERGVLDPNQPKNERKQRTIKSVIKSWAYKHLQITDEEWDTIKLDEIYQTYSEDSDIIFMKCHSPHDAMKLTSRVKNLPQDKTGQGPRIVMFIDKRAKARHRAYQQIARTLREEASEKGRKIQTNLRTGRTDFLLRLRETGDTTPWSDIPPLKISQKLPSFEVGLYKDIFNMSVSSSEDDAEKEDEEKMDDEDDLARIQKDLEDKKRQEDKKRDRNSSDDEIIDRRTSRWKSTPHPRGKGQPEIELTESSDDEVQTRTKIFKTIAFESPARRNNTQEDTQTATESTSQENKQLPSTSSEDDM